MAKHKGKGKDKEEDNGITISAINTTTSKCAEFPNIPSLYYFDCEFPHFIPIEINGNILVARCSSCGDPITDNQRYLHTTKGNYICSFCMHFPQ